MAAELTPVQAECAHSWHLYLEAAHPDIVLVICTWCAATLDDVWSGAMASMVFDFADFRVDRGHHTSSTDVMTPVDVRIEESVRYDLGTGTIEKTHTSFVRPQTFDLDAVEVSVKEEQPGSGTGWCAPSP